MVIELSVFDLSLAALLILALAGLSLRLGLGIEQRLVISAARTTIQLLLIGLVLADNIASARNQLRLLMKRHRRALLQEDLQDKADAAGLDVAKSHGVPTRVISHKDYPSRHDFDEALRVFERALMRFSNAVADRYFLQGASAVPTVKLVGLA